MPRYDRYSKLNSQINGSVKRGALTVRWADDGKSFTYTKDDKTYRYDIDKKAESETDKEEPARPTGGRRRGGGGGGGNPERGRQFAIAMSNDGKSKATTRDRNVYVSDADGKNEVAVTTEGSVVNRIKYGIASWVYGEELGVRQAMWWSPDDKKLAFYRFDESQVKDYFLGYDQTKIQDTLDQEAYPKAGAPNPKVVLYVYDVATKTTVTIGTDFDNGSAKELGEYVYDVKWSADGKELYFNRTNRKQSVMEWCAGDPATGKCRTIVAESQLQSWAENHPECRFLADNQRVIWSSERNGYKNYDLYDVSGKLINPLTQGDFDAGNIISVDEKAKVMFYMARDGENAYLGQLHRVGLDGKGDVRLTDPSLNHTVSVAPDGKHFVDVAEKTDTPPVTKLLDEKGKEIATLMQSDLTKFNELGLKKSERFTYKAADGVTTLYGTLSFPSDFDPAKKYPLLVSVYGGPESGGGEERFALPSSITEMGFLVVSFEGRGTNGRGKAFRDAVYGKLGVVEIDDQAVGVKFLAQRPYIDGKRVGIFGTSYGGYFSAMSILRYPDVYHVSCASSPVTDWRNYDSIYTERYMGLPDATENLAGYDAGSAMTYAKNLKGRFMLYFGTADNNVHPSNSVQLAQALNRELKRYDMMIGPDQGHSGMNSTRMWETFVQYLILDAPKDPLTFAWNAKASERKARKR